MVKAEGILKETGTNKTSASRTLMLSGGGLLVGLGLAALAGILLGYVAWDSISGILDWFKDLYFFFVAPYVGNQLGRGIERGLGRR